MSRVIYTGTDNQSRTTKRNIHRKYKIKLSNSQSGPSERKHKTCHKTEDRHCMV